MSRALKPAEPADAKSVEWALSHLRRARDLLVGAGCTNATASVRSAIKSTEGAQRHIQRRLHGTWEDTQPAVHERNEPPLLTDRVEVPA